MKCSADLTRSEWALEAGSISESPFDRSDISPSAEPISKIQVIEAEFTLIISSFVTPRSFAHVAKTPDVLLKELSSEYVFHLFPKDP